MRLILAHLIIDNFSDCMFRYNFGSIESYLYWTHKTPEEF